MKKIISAVITAAAALSFAAAGAQAASRTALINAALDRDEIHILYNDRMVEYEDVKPINNEDRIMIPFRAALENMGAEVGYDDSQRLVTSTKGDTTISFTLMDDTIYINKNGVESTMTMDVPMIIVSDRTLVPIRFMSEAFGMQVGWDGETQTVVIMDYDNYFNGFDEKIQNLLKLNSIEPTDYNSHQGMIVFDVKKSTEKTEEYFSFEVDGSANVGENGISAEGDLWLDADENLVTEDPTPVSALVTDKTIYVKTDLLPLISDTSSNSLLKAAANSGSTWFSIDLEKVFGKLGLTGDIMNTMQKALISGDKMDVEEILTRGMTREGDAVFSEALDLAQALDLYEHLDKYIIVNMTEKDKYSIVINMRPENFVNIIDDIYGLALNDEEKNSMLDWVNYDIDGYIINDGEGQVTELYLRLSNSGDTDFNLELSISDEAEKGDSSLSVSVPQKSYDITDMVISLIPSLDN